MVASPTPIPESSNRASDPLDIPRSAHGSARSRSPISQFAQGGFSSSFSNKYYTPYQASVASQWRHTRQNSIGKPFPRQDGPNSKESSPIAASAPSHRSAGWPSLPSYDAAKLPDTNSASSTASQTPFTQLYRQFSNSRHRSASVSNANNDSPGFSTSFGSTTSESPSTPLSQRGLELNAGRQYAERLEHVDADGMWSRPAMPNKIDYAPESEIKQEPSFRRSLQRTLSTQSKRRPSPMGERLLMGHLDAH
ncbi:hypothetical protein MYAM1_000535 [Malassezia yamatoensis]|uniref:Uncharacterized protein n=1 Tax=Malassezia yamatoensis TaxID=253288 RepID=A0AAJ5YPM9_9BASI|nr:hypothetical protein MYAM1_000535 [Malassezia yamatoensis]